jgi:hydroxypyruvate reductase
VLSGGEVTVTVRGDGLGGPNQELGLAGALALWGDETDAVLGSVDTDGVDGPTDAAGALVDAETVVDPDAARDALATSDVTDLLAEWGALLTCGYTGTNVNDLRALAVTGRE